MVPNAGARISNPYPPPQNYLPHPHLQSTIQIPMLGSNIQPNKGLQNPQQQGPQQQQGPNPSEIPLPPQSGQDFTLSSVLHFLQTEWRRYERDRNEWEIERAEMRVRVRECARSVACRVLHALTFALRLVLRSSKARGGHLTMSSWISCVVSRCSSTL